MFTGELMLEHSLNGTVYSKLEGVNGGVNGTQQSPRRMPRRNWETESNQISKFWTIRLPPGVTTHAGTRSSSVTHTFYLLDISSSM